MSGGGSEPEEPKPTQEERALAETGARRWNRFAREFKPVVKESAERTRTSESDVRDLAAQASAGSADEAATPIAEVSEEVPATGARRAQIAAETRAQAGGTGARAAEARPKLFAREQEGLMSAASQGREIEGSGADSLAQIGQETTNQEIEMTGLENQGRRRMRQGLLSGAATVGGAVASEQGWLDTGSGSGVAGNIPNSNL